MSAHCADAPIVGKRVENEKSCTVEVTSEGKRVRSERARRRGKVAGAASASGEGDQLPEASVVVEAQSNC